MPADERPPGPDHLTLLACGEMEVQGRMPWSSNQTFLVTVTDGLHTVGAIYKPARGERPLWDFPGGLHRREAAAWELSDHLGLGLVPPTVVRGDAPFGPGSVQLLVDADYEQHYFTLLEDPAHHRVLRRMAAFDVIANNADRKSGHCLRGSDGRLWAIDHGICFHEEYKLRTVLWDYAGQPLRPDILDDLKALRVRMNASDPLLDVFSQLLDKDEVRAFRRRLDKLIESGCYPDPGYGRYMPWPPV